MGRRVPRRADRHHAADPARHHAGPARRGAPAALRRHHPGPRAAGAVLGAGPQPRAAARAPAEPVPRRAAPGTRCARATPAKKEKTPRPEAADAELFGRLRAWRRAQAEAQKVPPYVVFSDATLVAIADKHPDSRHGAGADLRRRARPSSTGTPTRCSPCSAAPTRAEVAIGRGRLRASAPVRPRARSARSGTSAVTAAAIRISKADTSKATCMPVRNAAAAASTSDLMIGGGCARSMFFASLPPVSSSPMM